MLVALKICQISSLSAKELCGFVVYLIERRGRNVKLNSAEYVADAAFAPQSFVFVAENQIRILFIDVDDYSDYALEFVSQELDKAFCVGKFVSVNNEANAYFAIIPGPAPDI